MRFLLIFGIACLVKPALGDDPVVAPKPVAKKPALPVPKGFRTVFNAIVAKDVRTAATAVSTKVPYVGLNFAEGSNEIVAIAPGSPAAKAGLHEGDRITGVSDRSTPTSDRARQAILGLTADQPATFAIERDGKRREIELTPRATSRPLKLGAGSSRPRRARPVLGVNITRSEKPKGLRITSLSRGMPAQKSGLKIGDIILKLDNAKIEETADLLRQLYRKKINQTIDVVIKRKDDPADKQTTVKVKLTPRSGGTSRTTRRYWTKPSYRLAIVGIEYPDVKHSDKIDVADWNDSFFSRKKYNRANATGQRVYGSVNDYYHELSNGKFQIEGKMFDWIEVSKKRAEYSPGTGTSRRNRGALFIEALEKLTKREGKDILTKYDGVVFLYAGSRFRTSRGGLYWPHRASVTFRGRRLPYFICPEGGGRMTNISVFCHEFGHMLGMPDLYARPENPGSEGVSVWCAMSNQAGSGRPQHFSAWCKVKLGWLKPTVIDPRTKQKLILSPVNGSDRECFQVLLRPDGSEYLLLENRRKTGFDSSLPAEGLLVWRIVNNRPILEESHGITGPSGPRVYRNSVPYPSASNDSFTPYTTPSSRSKLGGGLPVYITNIKRLADGRVTFYIGYEFH